MDAVTILLEAPSHEVLRDKRGSSLVGSSNRGLPANRWPVMPEDLWLGCMIPAKG